MTCDVCYPLLFDGAFVQLRTGEKSIPLGTPGWASTPKNVLSQRIALYLVFRVSKRVAFLLIDIAYFVVGSHVELDFAEVA